MLAKYHPHIWQRVMTMLTFTGSKEIKLWGGLVVLQRNGLRRAEHWLREQKVDPKESNQLLQRLDLAPVTLDPRQLIGTVAYIGKGDAGSEWFLPPPKLESGQGWYEVNINLMKDGDKWSNAPFSELSDRSSILLWRILGLSINSSLGVVLYDPNGKSQTATLTAQSLWVSDNGSLRILASGEVALAPLLNKSILQPLVTSGGGFNPPNGSPVKWQSLSSKTIERIVRTMYRELQRNGEVSLSIEDFGVLVQQQWTLTSVSLDGSGKPEYLLLLDREKVDLGDRHYPLAIAFSSDGSLIFSDMSGGRIWIDVLPSSIPDSGTAGRLAQLAAPGALTAGGAGLGLAAGGTDGAQTGGITGALATLALLAGGSKTGQKAINQTITARPELLKQAADYIAKRRGLFGTAVAVPALQSQYQ
jgi:hypothetical protein